MIRALRWIVLAALLPLAWWAHEREWRRTRKYLNSIRGAGW